MAELPQDLGSMEPDMDPIASPSEKDHGDGHSLTRPESQGDGSKAKTAEALRLLGAGSPYDIKR